MKVHHAVAEAFTRKKIESFIEWLKQNKAITVLNNFMLSKVLTDLQTNPNPEMFQSCVSKANKLFILFEEYENVISNAETSPMAAFWQSYLEMFELLLQFQKATKSSNWGLHLDSCEKLLPWFHAYD